MPSGICVPTGRALVSTPSIIILPKAPDLMVASPFIAPYLPVESPSFRFSHSYIFKINRLYDILENELNQNKLISGLMGELNIAVTYLLIKEHARVCQSAPCMFYCIRLSFFLKMYKFDFFLSM